jgi:hypothetical protein
MYTDGVMHYVRVPRRSQKVGGSHKPIQGSLLLAGDIAGSLHLWVVGFGGVANHGRSLMGSFCSLFRFIFSDFLFNGEAAATS